MTLDEAIVEQEILVILFDLKGSQKQFDVARMALATMEQEQARRPLNFDFEDRKLPGETE